MIPCRRSNVYVWLGVRDGETTWELMSGVSMADVARRSAGAKRIIAMERTTNPDHLAQARRSPGGWYWRPVMAGERGRWRRHR